MNPDLALIMFGAGLYLGAVGVFAGLEVCKWWETMMLRRRLRRIHNAGRYEK